MLKAIYMKNYLYDKSYFISLPNPSRVFVGRVGAVPPMNPRGQWAEQLFPSAEG